MADVKNAFYKAAGVGFLAMAKAKSLMSGYDRARPFSQDDIDHAVTYDMKVVDEWFEALIQYSGRPASQVSGGTVLELGPGPDFGVGLYLRSLGVARYCAADAFPLAFGAPSALYDALLARTCANDPSLADSLRKAVPSAERPDGDGTIRYVVRSDFDVVAAFPELRADYVFSQAAFEHFDDVEATLRQVTRVTRAGGTLVAGIDLRTHTRWIREMDPLNIYRYSDGFYRLFSFRGMPNRVPASEYIRILQMLGWRDIRLMRVDATEPDYFERVRDCLAPRFRDDESRNLWIVLCATRGDAP